jgi:hypothetical protein
MRNILIMVLVLVLLGGVFWYVNKEEALAPENITEENEAPVMTQEEIEAKSKAETFSGKLEAYHPGCFVDGECYVVVDGKHVTTTMGWSQETVGSVLGVPSFGDLEKHIGEEMEVYAQKKADGKYTLYGSLDFYIKLK